MNMRKHEGNTLIKFCAETKANSKGEPAKKKKTVPNSYLRHLRRCPKGAGSGNGGKGKSRQWGA